jgi:hypothetical protein
MITLNYNKTNVLRIDLVNLVTPVTEPGVCRPDRQNSAALSSFAPQTLPRSDLPIKKTG